MDTRKEILVTLEEIVAQQVVFGKAINHIENDNNARSGFLYIYDELAPMLRGPDKISKDKFKVAHNYITKIIKNAENNKPVTPVSESAFNNDKHKDEFIKAMNEVKNIVDKLERKLT